MSETATGFLSILQWLEHHQIHTILALLAILFATIQYFDARRQDRAMKGIAESMSTRFIGQFPSNMQEIVDVVKRTDSTLDILVDVCAYGHYSRPTVFAEYRREIQEKRRQNRRVRMIVYSKSVFERLRLEQFPEDRFASEQTTSRFREYFAANPHLDEPATWKAFHAILLDDQEIQLKVLKKSGVEIRATERLVQMSLWIEDREDAVFSFQNEIDREKEVSFRTRDGNLIAVLQSVFDQAWKESATISAGSPASAD